MPPLLSLLLVVPNDLVTVDSNVTILNYFYCSFINVSLALMDPVSPGGTITETKTTTTTVTRTTLFTPNSPLRCPHNPADTMSPGRLYLDLSSFASSPAPSIQSYLTDSRAGDFPAGLSSTPTNLHQPLPADRLYHGYTEGRLLLHCTHTLSNRTHARCYP